MRNILFPAGGLDYLLAKEDYLNLLAAWGRSASPTFFLELNMLPNALAALRNRLKNLSKRTPGQEATLRELDALDGGVINESEVRSIEKSAGSQQMSGGIGTGCPCCGN
jgi:hypothetical protein